MNTLYAKSRKLACDTGLNLATASIKVALVTSGYTPDTTNHQFYSDITPGSNVLGVPAAFTYSSDTNGVFKVTGSVTITNVPAGTVTYLVYFEDTGTTTTSPLIGISDGNFTITAAVTAGSSSTSIQVDPLGFSVASGVTFTLGGVSVTTTSPGSATTTATASSGATTISVSALGQNYANGTVLLLNGVPAATLTASASSGATSLTVAALPATIPSGSTLVAAAGSVGLRTLSVSSTSGSISQGGTGTAPIAGTGLPVTSTGTSFAITITPDSVAGLFSI